MEYNFSCKESAIDYLFDNTCRGLIMKRKHIRVRSDDTSYLIIEDQAKEAYIVYQDCGDGSPDFELVDYDEAVCKYFKGGNQ